MSTLHVQPTFVRPEEPARPRRGLAVLVALAVLAVASVAPFGLFEYLGAKEVMVVQSPLSGTLNWHKDPGVKWQGFGTVTKYPKRSQLWFSARADQGAREDESLKVRFNDGGHAKLSGSISWEMPLGVEHLNAVHTRYGSYAAVEQQLVRTVVEKAVYMTGPLMSSHESYAARRPELLRFIEDQVQHGVYATEVREAQVPDIMTGQPKTVKVTSIVRDAKGAMVRQDTSPLQEFGIRTFNPSLNEIIYDGTVEAQIKQQQEATMQIQTAAARARQAEQEAITAEKSGAAAAAKARWEQEVIKARMVTEAQQRVDVARLDVEAAELHKREQILLGEGEAERKRLVMSADGALEKKLEAYVRATELWSGAIKEHQGPLVPSVVMAPGPVPNAATSSQGLVDLLTARTARDLAVDMTIRGTERTAR